MPEEALFLAKVPIRVPTLMQIARQRKIRLKELDEGYLVHALFRELWEQRAPAPHLLRGSGRVVDAWGYTHATADELRASANSYGDPSCVAALELDDIHCKRMPKFEHGRRLGFHLRACPVSRRGRAQDGQRQPLERDVFLARVGHAGADVRISREDVYRDWLVRRIIPERVGARVEHVRVDSFTRERLTRLTQKHADEGRRARILERPDVRFSGDLIVEDAGLFMQTLGKGIGRHKAFGFGMLLIVPPGGRWAAAGEGSERQC